ncbi:AraC family transcriptional regulator [Metasolibacillus sp.]|uniref:helix-turn-helix transcriptional regulator n=1 Tax=Metasolibacillus sp. TaxID=2703680 RepID=UPI0025FF6194|nr:AraC family transcriptional regulator [Metasolibacillus sp.]MCT6924815.1 AraC family transcriptional regulator [Metasolibacillus sp.]MCT6941083.1 AraC family transcriptional regulator [Metasolibacillus sp.]
MHKVINYIEEHLHEPLEIERIAKHAGFSKFHLHRVFKKYVGMSIAEYIRMRRLASASAMLLYTKEKIIDIAFHNYFESQEAFTRAFKKYYHLPPGQYRKLMSIMWKNKEESFMDKSVKGWILSGSDLYNYEMGVDHAVVHQGKASGYLKSKTVLEGDSFATMMQQFKADNYVNKRIRLSGFLKTKDVGLFSSMWMRVDNANGDTIQFDNMSNRSITGTTNWSLYSIVLDVPKESTVISFGIILSGRGQVWVDQLTFEEVDESVLSTNLEIQSDILDEPVNLSFEE